MIRTFFFLFLRTLIKNKWLLVINVVSFSTTLTIFLFVAIFVNAELSYNKGVSGYDRITRISTEVITSDKTQTLSLTNAFVGPILKDNFQEIENYLRLKKPNEAPIIKVDNTLFTGSKLYETDASFFDVFDLSLSYGSKGHLLNNPNDIVISNSLNQKYFNGNDPQSSVIIINDQAFKVYRSF